MFGYNGKFLSVDLTSGQTGAIDLSEDQAKSFIGGAGLSAALIYDSVKNGNGPSRALKPPGICRGTAHRLYHSHGQPFCCLWHFSIDRFLGRSDHGRRLPVPSQSAGFDGIFITGKAKRPVYLYIKDGRAEIRDATHLWGQDIYQTQKILRDEIKETGMSVSCIGQAGEKLVRYACVMNDRGRAAGRCGMGALMGSKNLKAVIAGGSAKSTAADAEKMAALTKQARDAIAGNFMSIAYREYGTLLYMDMGMVMGDAPAKYFSKSVFPGAQHHRPGAPRGVHRDQLCLPGLSNRMRPLRQELQKGS